METVNGVTFDPSTLFFVSVGVDLNSKPFESESWIHPQPSTFSEAEMHAMRMLDRSSLVTFVRIMTSVTDDLSIRVVTVWR